MRVCVIGAGPSGIAATKNCLRAGFDIVTYEKSDHIGGNWVFDVRSGHSSVYENTHIISSKVWSEYEDFPMPAGYPDYPNHRQMHAYFVAYADQFGVRARIEFNTEVTHVSPEGDGFLVRVRQGAQTREERFDALMVANGHHWDPRMPSYPGVFNGRIMHSHDFKRTDDSWRAKRVLVIGAGNSGCDVAVETARVASQVFMSMRRPQWFIPKFIFGVPSDVFGARSVGLPSALRNWAFAKLLRLVQGRYSSFGLPDPTAGVFSQHPTANSDLIDLIRHSRIRPKPAIASFAGDEVLFEDGSRELVDIIVACTGFYISFPFFDSQWIDFRSAARVPLYLRMLHPLHPRLYFIGLFQPFGCLWPLADYQAMLACAELAGRYRRPSHLSDLIAREKPHYEFNDSPRHSTQVDSHFFRRELARELRKAGIDIGKAPAGRDYKAWS